MSGHYYKSQKNGKVRLLKDVTTPAQARKHGSALVSVTTLLGYLPSDYINNVWKPQQYVKHARETDLDVEQIRARMWGERTCPETGNVISSSDFGTNAHARLEEHMNAIIEGHDLLRDDPYDPIVSQTVRFLELNGFTPIAAERMMACEERGTAGTIDLVAEKDGKICLMDYKFRSCPDGKGKFYPEKDCSQLAVEAQMVMEQDGLDYFPDCYSICVDTETGTPHVKQWTGAAVKKGLQRFLSVLTFYYLNPELGYKD